MKIKYMKLICFYLMLLSTNVLAQSDIFATNKLPIAVDLNNKNYIRVYNGQIVSDNYVIDRFENIKQINKSSAIEMGLNFDKPIMIINSDKIEIENKIYKELFEQIKFIEYFKYPLDTRLPIAIGNKLIPNNEKERLLSGLDLSKIKKIEYLEPQNDKVDKNITPFGVINLKVK